MKNEHIGKELPKITTYLLHIEDESVVSESINTILSHYGIQTITYDRPSSLKKGIEEGDLERLVRLDGIITDGKMFNETAYDTLKIRNEYYPSVPLILHSGSDEYIKYFRENGYAILPKPIMVKDLLATLEQQCNWRYSGTGK